ncbi:competence/damage-inducible protein A [Psychroflexus montanilacus]|uniref:competence/damage-inducible protein A n=1 Tax=Psychroflexus montanilacus TaxID=2873598 RepID=UPI001CC9AAA6|nr:competence/damage-inducible protein A [Psychroflexus montanilacus]MBZ9652033.1 competence/damage-inducible protein A [Psychroflexus montanilacus]
MQAEIITIGDEILIGQIIDTNSAYIAKQLNKIGVDVYQITSIEDEKAHILNAFEEASKRSNIIIITGGLGPTKDDITKHTFCEYFNDELVLDKKVLAHVEDIFKKYVNTPILEANRSQAWLPSQAITLHNEYGTAPGMWFEKDGVVYISMPGVPYEMKSILTEQALPRLQDRFRTPFIIHKTVLTYGLGESAIADRIEDWENQLPSFIKLAYLPSLGRVRLRLSARGEDEQLLKDGLNSAVESLNRIIGDIIKGYEDEQTLEERIAEAFSQKGKTLVTAESCTGGRLAAKFTEIPGASGYFIGSVVSYATSAKNDVLQIPKELIEKYSVVSSEITKAMAEKAKAMFKADFAIATTGNAGPTKGDSNAEIGTVFIAIATTNDTQVHEFQFGKHRERVTQKAVNKALELIYEAILK